jgi:hypothetical protein
MPPTLREPTRVRRPFQKDHIAVEHLIHTTDDTLDLAEEEILTHTVSDEALEATAGTERGANWSAQLTCVVNYYSC